jgi:hypothetical protein
MRPSHRLSLSRAALLVLLLLDLLAATAFVFNQWLVLDLRQAWVLSALVTLPAMALLWPFIDKLVSGPVFSRDVHFPGDKIPRAGQ